MFRKLVKQRLRAFQAAFKGIQYLCRHETHFQIHVIAALISLTAGWYYQILLSEWIAIVLCIGFVWTSEAFNTSVERWTDLAEKKQMPLAGLVKDLAAAAVLLSTLTALTVGCIIFIPKIF